MLDFHYSDFGQTGNNRKFQMIGKILKHLRLKNGL